MISGALHANELHVDEPLVAELLGSQFPRWADVPLRRFTSMGAPSADFPLDWSIYPWLDGRSADLEPFSDLTSAVGQLAQFIRNRMLFRRQLALDDATWERGRGWALSVGLIALPYYRKSNPIFASTAERMIAEVLADERMTAFSARKHWQNMGLSTDCADSGGGGHQAGPG